MCGNTPEHIPDRMGKHADVRTFNQKDCSEMCPPVSYVREQPSERLLTVPALEQLLHLRESTFTVVAFTSLAAPIAEPPPFK